MAIVLSAHKLTQTFGAKTLFQDLSFAIEEGQKIGLIGPNGAGKSTLLQILAKEQIPDQGQISTSTGFRLGYLKQNPNFSPDEDVYSAVMSGSMDPYDANEIQRGHELISRLELEWTLDGVLVKDLSGGWKKRVALARELMKQPHLLLLDEPTNHFDVESILWLENFIRSQNQLAIMTVTHDRLFLQKTCDMIFDLDPRNPDGLIKSKGSYADYLVLKEQLLDAQRTLEQVKKNTLRRETEWLRRGAQARQTKQKARIERAQDLHGEVDDLKQKNQQRTVSLEFLAQTKLPKKMIEAKEISRSAQGKNLFSNFSLLIGPGTRMGLLGANGCGKSTLLRALVGNEQPETGSVFIQDTINISYFEQQKESLNQEVSLLKAICPEGDYVHFQGEPVYARSYLSRFLFRYDQHDLPVKKLSGGEQSRLLIAQLMLKDAQVLVLDEPTNDLDIETLDVLQECLRDFHGAVILVSHDRYFMDQVVDQIYAFTHNPGEILRFVGYHQWESWFDETRGERQKIKSNDSSGNGKAGKSKKNKIKTKLSYKEQLELDGMEETILREEKQLSTLQEEMNSPGVQSNYQRLTEVTESLRQQQSKIDRLYERWQALNATGETK
ncbi:MAG: ABC transporter ATP-binding protein [Bdellovibrio sp. CG10_big_fil_rev_8_21_14_0_10_47_8]|nr:MAG: ABC transporter ATP-binding protein [Bdellovibrio sp. CG10_big_fil_rev_8_21_14_0_10_47_8]